MRRLLYRHLAELTRPVQVVLPPWTYLSQITLSAASHVLANDAFPEDVENIEVLFNGVSSAGSTQPATIRVGPSAGVVATGYRNIAGTVTGTNVAEEPSTDGFRTVRAASSASSLIYYGVMRLTRWAPTEDRWLASMFNHNDANGRQNQIFGDVTLAGAIADVEITTPGGVQLLSGEARVRYR